MIDSKIICNIFVSDARCNSQQFTCDDNSCIENYRVCDRYNDCPDGEDERSCGSGRLILILGHTIVILTRAFCVINNAWQSLKLSYLHNLYVFASFQLIHYKMSCR